MRGRPRLGAGFSPPREVTLPLVQFGIAAGSGFSGPCVFPLAAAMLSGLSLPQMPDGYPALSHSPSGESVTILADGLRSLAHSP